MFKIRKKAYTCMFNKLGFHIFMLYPLIPKLNFTLQKPINKPRNTHILLIYVVLNYILLCLTAFYIFGSAPLWLSNETTMFF